LYEIITAGNRLESQRILSALIYTWQFFFLFAIYMHGGDIPQTAQLIRRNLMKFKQVALALSLTLVLTMVASSAMASPHHAQTPDLSPSFLDFGDQLTGSTSAAQTITLTNNDLADLTIDTLSVSGEFALSNDLCSGQVITSTASCTFDVTFSPISNGAKNGSVSIPSDSVSSPDTVTLSGVGVGNTWYVASTGDDGNDCYSAGTPCATINGAIAKAAAGDTILVAEGTYFGTGIEVVLIDKSISLSGGWDASFSSQSSNSTIDGENTRNGITINSGGTASIDHFVIQHGYQYFKGGGIVNWGVLTLTNSSLISNFGQIGGGGISNSGTLIADNIIVTKNKMGVSGFGGGSGGGGIYNHGDMTINNSSITANTILGDFSGSAIYSIGNLTINHSLISQNTGSIAINAFIGTLKINNSTISSNVLGGITDYLGVVTINNSTITKNFGIGGINEQGTNGQLDMQNSILAGNSQDCTGTITSQGYNIIGDKKTCNFQASTGDQVGTSTTPIDPLLGILHDNGGYTATHALWADSPAIDAGNPATCLPTDQRGVDRPVGSACDIGAYEGSVPGPRVISISSTSPNPTGSPVLNYTVKFSKPVTGVDATDFSLTVTGNITGQFVQSTSGSGNTYTVSVNTGKGNGTIRFNLIDDDSIIDSSNIPLGATGTGNGNFASRSYTILAIPTPATPAGTIADPTPQLTWNKIAGATKYKYEIRKGAVVIYSKIVNSAVCVANTCKTTPTIALENGNHKWRVTAFVDGQWRGFSGYQAFLVSAPLAGFWKGGPNYSEFYITPDRGYIDNFSIYVTVYACNIYNQKLTYTPLVPLTYNKGFNRLEFSYSNSYYFNGYVYGKTTGHSTFGMNGYYWPGCGYLYGGPFQSSPVWGNRTQPTASGSEVFEFAVSPLPKDLMIPPTIFDLFNP
jgi:hypothetical protein